MKIDIKMIVIIGLILVVVGFIMFGNKGGVDSKSYEQERAKLQEQIDSLQIEKSKVDDKIRLLDVNYHKMINENEKLENVNDSLNNQIAYQSNLIYEKTKEYNNSQNKIKELNKKLADLKANPPNREGEDLINNLQKRFN